VATLSTGALSAAMSGALTYLPLYVQGALGGSPAEAGATVAPLLLGWPLTGPITPAIMSRIGHRAPVWIGSGIVAAAYAALGASVYLLPGTWPVYIAMFFIGTGMGLAMSALLISAQVSVGWERRGVVTATNMFARNMGGALGVGTLGAMLAARLSGAIDPARVRALLDPDARRTGVTLDPRSAVALGDALRPILATLAAIALANAVIVAFYPKAVTPPAPSPR